MTATDLSEGMLELARQQAEERGAANVSFERMDAEALDLSDGSFNVALCSLGLMYVPDPDQALQEMHRVQSDVCPLFFQLGTGDALLEAFHGAGFTDVTTERFSVTLPFETPEEACSAAFWGGAVALAWRKFDEEKREGARAEYLESIAPYRNGRGYDIPGAFVIACGHKPRSR